MDAGIHQKGNKPCILTTQAVVEIRIISDNFFVNLMKPEKAS